MSQAHYEQDIFDLCEDIFDLCAVVNEACVLLTVNGLKYIRNNCLLLLNIDVFLQLQMKYFLCQ